jgi:hypothetical protein
MNKKDIEAINEVYKKVIFENSEITFQERSFEDLKRGYRNSFKTIDRELYRTENDYPNNPTTVTLAFSYTPPSEGDYDTPATTAYANFLDAFVYDGKEMIPVDLNEFDLEDTPQWEIDKAENELIANMNPSSEENYEDY